MKHFLSLVSVFFLLTSAALANGPFGVSKGDDPLEMGCQSAGEVGYYQCDKLPKSHPRMDFYIIHAEQGIGVCRVRGVGRDVAMSGTGSALKSEIETLAAQIGQTYGKGTLVDLLSPGSVWDEYSDWAMSISIGDRFYAYRWDEPNEAMIENAITDIYVAADATSRRNGYAVVEFYFDNHEACEEAQNNRGADVF